VTTPPKLRDAIERDLKPARPLARPSRRALMLVPIAVAVVVGIPAWHAFRPDMPVIGFLRAWGFSIGQAVAGLMVVFVALREAIPGRSLSRTAIALTLLLGIALPGIILLLTTSTFTIGPESGDAFVEGLACFRVSALASLPALLFAAVLVARAYPLHAMTAGALYGLGAGLMSDAGLRLYCGYSTPGHVVFGHIGAVAAVAIAGAAVAMVIERVRRRRAGRLTPPA
jgi:hypothetical protein